MLDILPPSYQGGLDRYARIFVLPTPRAYGQHRTSNAVHEPALPQADDILKLTWIQVINHVIFCIETQCTAPPQAQLEHIVRKTYRCVTRQAPSPQTFLYLERGFYELKARLAQLELQGQLRLTHFSATQAFTIAQPHVFLGQYR